MPLYEYTCRQCDHAFEALVFNGEQPQCPHCQGHDLEKHWSVPAQPRSEASALPVRACQSSGPPCGPVCGRWPGNGAG
jgi:putative FmdB family regulatory protein